MSKNLLGTDFLFTRTTNQEFFVADVKVVFQFFRFSSISALIGAYDFNSLAHSLRFQFMVHVVLSLEDFSAAFALEVERLVFLEVFFSLVLEPGKFLQTAKGANVFFVFRDADLAEHLGAANALFVLDLADDPKGVQTNLTLKFCGELIFVYTFSNQVLVNIIALKESNNLILHSLRKLNLLQVSFKNSISDPFLKSMQNLNFLLLTVVEALFQEFFLNFFELRVIYSR